MFKLLLSPLLLLLAASPHIRTQAYSIGDVDPRALQGIWRLTSLDKDGLPFEKRPAFLESDPEKIWKSRGFLPMKEFTTYPKKKLALPQRKQTEMFIKLKDDMTFEQCSSLLYDDREDGGSMEEMLAADVLRREIESFAMKGTWDFVDGKLILASDRPEKKPFSVYDEGDSVGSNGKWSTADTILVGKVSVKSEESLTGNLVIEEMLTTSDETKSDSESLTPQEHSTSRKSQQIDVHLSVPKGKIKTGKFMYPKHHPSFFEQPLFNPHIMGNFELKQVLGDHNVNDDDEDDLVELFRKDDLAGKRFYLSAFPLAERKRKDWRGRVIKNDDESSLQLNLQVVAVELFANNTFTTVYGLGSSEVRRGKWSIIGEKRDQIWMQVYRFGFGRSVSYGTYSEGMSLTQDDEKAYWGKIAQVEARVAKSSNKDDANHALKKIEIDGAIMLGTGLEPCSIGRFKMIEIEEEIGMREVETDGDYEEMSLEDVEKNANSFDLLFGGADAEDKPNPFDQPGSFE